MPLPILQPTSQATPQTLVRLFHQTELIWTRHIGEEHILDLGTALLNPNLKEVADANLVLDASGVYAGPVGDAVTAAEAYFRDRGSRLSGLIPSPSADPEAVAALVRYLTSAGWTAHPRQIFRLARRPMASPLQMPSGIKIIPARASFRHARQLAEESAGDPQTADAALMHLDDPHVDALLALRDGQAVAGVAVLTMGEVGRIDQLFVSERSRREGLGELMLSRALEICARGLIKHVLLSSSSDETAAQSLFQQFGFEAIGTINQYRSPGGLLASDFGEHGRTATS